jgi:hypothetical protein
MTEQERYFERRRLAIEEMAQSPYGEVPVSLELETACADDIMDGAAAELMGLDLDNVSPECRLRALAFMAVARGEQPTQARLASWNKYLSEHDPRKTRRWLGEKGHQILS